MKQYPGKEFKEREAVEWFDSMSDAVRVAKTRKHMSSIFSRSFTQIGSWEEVDKLCREGWDEGAAKLKPLFDQVEAMIIPTEGQTMTLDYAGFLPCVPSYLAGDPMHMRNMVPAESSIAPIRIVSDIGVSGGVSIDQIAKHAAAIGCFVTLLSLYRPVELYVTDPLPDASHLGYYLPVIKVASSPFDLPSLAWGMMHPGATRCVCFSLMNSDSNYIPWAHFNGKSVYKMQEDEYQRNMRKALMLDPEDMLIRGMRLSDTDGLKDPVAWAKRKVAALGIHID